MTGQSSPALSVEEVREQRKKLEDNPTLLGDDYNEELYWLFFDVLDAIADGHTQARELAAAARGRR